METRVGLVGFSWMVLSMIGSAQAAEPVFDQKTAGTPEPGDIPAPADVAGPPADAEKTISGLASKVLTPGIGKEKPTAEDTVKVHYTGWTTDGKMFDSSLKRGKPASFSLKSLIAGWTEGLQLMVKGERRRFWIPEKLAYQGRPGPPQGMLVFDVELLDILRDPAVPEDLGNPPKDANKTASGLVSKVLQPGTGKEHPTAACRVKVHYSGWTQDGRLFDSTIKTDQPVTIGVDQVFAGWTEGLQLMVVGERRRFWIPQELTHTGKAGVPPGLLVFDMELLEILPKGAPELPRDY